MIIHKHKLLLGGIGEDTLTLTYGSNILSVGIQDHQPVLWESHDEKETRKVDRKFIGVFTGQEWSGPQGLKHLGTVTIPFHASQIVVHVFEDVLALENSDLRTPEQWLAAYYPKTRIADGDGWGQPGSLSFDTPISRSDFERHLSRCMLMQLL